MSDNLKFYINCFTHLRRDSKYGGAPHKPILLLALIKAYEDEVYLSNKIDLLPELVGNFKDIWNILVKTRHTPNFALPFYHMKNENSEYWKLIPKSGFAFPTTKSNSIRSFKGLVEALDHVVIDPLLANLLVNKEYRNILGYHLLETYFPGVTSPNINIYRSIFEDYKEAVLNENPTSYTSKMKKLIQSSKEKNNQEEVYLRGAAFKREIPKIYNYTCAISEYRIHTMDNISMIDACHIIPFSKSFDDTISNGIALCPNIHRAFDRGLISMDENYRVLISGKFEENESQFSLKQFENKKMLLPDFQKYYPGHENLRIHREKWGFQ